MLIIDPPATARGTDALQVQRDSRGKRMAHQ